MKIRFNSDDELPLNKMIEIPSMAIVVGVVKSVLISKKNLTVSLSIIKII